MPCTETYPHHGDTLTCVDDEHESLFFPDEHVMHHGLWTNPDGVEVRVGWGTPKEDET